MKVRIKKLNPEAVIPAYLTEGDAGLDLTAVDNGYATTEGTLMFGTGLSLEIPKGYVGLVFPRSSVYKTGYRLSNSVGVIDSGYRGEVKVNFDLSVPFTRPANYSKGDRIAQLIIIPHPEIEFEEVRKLTDTHRGTGGYGSTGK